MTTELIMVGLSILAISGIAYAINLRNKFYMISVLAIVALLLILGMSAHLYLSIDGEDEDDLKLKNTLMQVIIVSTASAVVTGVILFISWKFNLQGTYTFTGKLDEISSQVVAQKELDAAKDNLREASDRLSEARKSRKAAIEQGGSGKQTSSSSSQSSASMSTSSKIGYGYDTIRGASTSR